jgi:hypothetical protein
VSDQDLGRWWPADPLHHSHRADPCRFVQQPGSATTQVGLVERSERAQCGLPNRGFRGGIQELPDVRGVHRIAGPADRAQRQDPNVRGWMAQ